MIIDLNKICDDNQELTWNGSIDGHDREFLIIDNEYLYKTVCPNCGEHWQFRESDVIIKKFYVWGSGMISPQNKLIGLGEHSEEAEEYAMSKGLKFELGSEDWAEEVMATSSEMDMATRFEQNVLGYREVE